MSGCRYWPRRIFNCPNQFRHHEWLVQERHAAGSQCGPPNIPAVRSTHVDHRCFYTSVGELPGQLDSALMAQLNVNDKACRHTRDDGIQAFHGRAKYFRVIPVGRQSASQGAANVQIIIHNDNSLPNREHR